ncbi:MAG: DUF1194 domain-containing protein [Kiloniellaceae bacterium]
MRRSHRALSGSIRAGSVGAGFALLVALAPAARADPVALELVLAVDASSSIDYGEFQLQMRGLAKAFRHPAVAAAIKAAAPEGIAVSLMLWSGKTKQLQVVDWTKVHDAATASALAARIEQAPRAVLGGPTAVGSAIRFSIGLQESNRFAGKRRVIDVSGDGRANHGELAADARADAVARGMTVNGLAILNEQPDLAAYYLAGVIGGPGAFLLTADDYHDFARAIRRKLITEITGSPIVHRFPGAPVATAGLN